MGYTLEICANSIQSALNAQAGGADRIELCDNMHEGGTTPSYGMIRGCVERLSIDVFPIIRPRGGDFVYTDEEFEVMKADVIMARELGCQGVVFGILKSDGTVDLKRNKELLSLARPMSVTFHRAIDCSADMEEALEMIISMGFDRVLSSGGAVTAVEGLSRLQALVRQAAGRIRIMPGSGITPKNLSGFLQELEVTEFHSTAKHEVGESSAATVIPYLRSESSEEIVRELRTLLV